MKNSTSNKKQLSPKQREELLKALKARFEKNLTCHKGLDFIDCPCGSHLAPLTNLLPMFYDCVTVPLRMIY